MELKKKESSFIFLQNSVIFCVLYPIGYEPEWLHSLQPSALMPGSLRVERVKGVVCKVNCVDCNSIYIGETERMVKTRLDEYKQDANKDDESKTGLSSHIKNTGHVIDWENTELMYKRRCGEKRCKYSILNKNEEIKSMSEISENLIL